MSVTVTTTAMLRPDILERTYSAFCKRVEGLSECNLLINIDPAPATSKHMLAEMEKVCHNYFKNVVINFPSQPNFSRAINWLWQTADSDFIFHLEDDWDITQNVSLQEMMDVFVKNQEMLQVRLRHKPGTGYSFGLSPSLIAKRFYKHYAGRMSASANPETQLRKPIGFKPIGEAIPCQNVLRYPENVVLLDIGRKWKTERNIRFADRSGRRVPDGRVMEIFVKWDK